MKIKISGMMDYIQDESVYVGGETGVSAERIKERTMASLGAAPKERGKSRRAYRILLIAAAVAAVLTVSAAAVAGASRVPSLAEMQGPEYNLGPSMSEVGLYGSAEYQAALEWHGYLEKWVSYGKNKSDHSLIDVGMDVYDYYGAHSQEARDTLDALAKKYGLKLHKEKHTQVLSLEELYSTVGVEGFMPEMGSLGKFEGNEGHYPLSGKVYDDGTFSFIFSAALPGDSYAIYKFDSYAKGTFHRGHYRIVRDTELEEWTYTTDDGVEVMLVLGSYQSFMAAELENCFVFAQIYSGRDNDSHITDSADISYGEPTLNRELLEAFADSFDFTAINALAAQSP